MIAAPIILLLAIGGQAQEPGCDRQSTPEVSPFDPAHPRAAEEPSGEGLWIGGQAFGATDIAGVKTAQSDYSGEWVIDIQFTPTGVAKFANAQRCRLGKAIETSVDGKVVTAPFLQEYILGNRVQLSGGFATEAEAAALTSRIALAKD
jgi:preprotein translocase subunit SecD